MPPAVPSAPLSPPEAVPGALSARQRWRAAVPLAAGLLGSLLLGTLAWPPAEAPPAGPGLTGLALLGTALPLLLGGLAWRARVRTAADAARAQAQVHALTRSERQLRVAEQLAGLGSFDWHPVTGALHWSDQHYRLWGLTPGAVQPSYAVFRAGVHADDVQTLEALLQQSLQDGRPYDCQHRVVWPDGSVHHIRARGEVRRDAGGTAVRMIGTVQDVTAHRQAQTALADSLDNLQLTLNATGDGIFASDVDDPHQPLLFVNARVLEIWRIPAHRAAGLTPAEVMAYARPLFVDAEREFARVAEVIASHQPQEDRLELRDGRVLLRRCVPTRDGGRPLRVWGFRDITAEAQALRELHAAEAQQRALLAAFPGYIACIGADLRYRHVNPRLARLLGSPPEALVGRSVADQVGGERATLVIGRIQRALAGEVLSFERHHPAQDGRPALEVLVTLAPGLDSGTGHTVCYAFGTDITPLKRTEAALVAARDDAERANRAKSAFLSSMSHELRTPLNAVLGFAHLLEIDTHPALTPHQRRRAREIQRGGRHLLALISDLLDLARIEADRLPMQCQPVPVRAVLAECVALLAPLAEPRAVQLVLPEGDDDLAVLADRTRLRQVLLNLLGNAIKFNHDGGWVRLHGDRQGRQVRLAVVDSGPGIAPDQQRRLFRQFERLGADGGPVEGAGIGLALSQQLVQQMGGEIGVLSAAGQGSTFWLTLPAADGQAEGASDTEAAALAGVGPAAAWPAGGPPRRVLYIEDNPVNTQLMAAMFEHLPGLQLHCAEQPEQGLAQALADPPALVLLDIQMPGLDGYAVLQRLREAPATRQVPVIAVSANALPQDLARGQAAGFADYLCKPLALPRLAAALAAVLDAGPATPGPGPTA